MEISDGCWIISNSQKVISWANSEQNAPHHVNKMNEMLCHKRCQSDIEFIFVRGQLCVWKNVKDDGPKDVKQNAWEPF